MSKKIALFLALFILVTAFVMPAKAEAYTTDDGALIVSASTTLKAEIRLNIYVALPASVLADETAYAVFTQNDNTVTQYVKDAKKNVETVFGKRRIFIPKSISGCTAPLRERPAV